MIIGEHTRHDEEDSEEQVYVEVALIETAPALSL